MKKAVVIGGAAVLCIAGLWLWLARDRSEAGGEARPGADVATARAARGAPKAPGTAEARRRTGAAAEREPDAPASEGAAAGEPRQTDTPDAMEVTRTLNALLDDDTDTEAILREARRLSRHPDPEVRSEAAFAFHWVGLQALPDLTKMLGDPDPDVEDDVRTFWKDGVAGIENEADKADMLEAASEVFGDTISLDFLDDLVMELSMLEDDVALPRLVETLKRLEDKEQVELVTEAIEAITMPDEPAVGKAEVLRKAAQFQAELEAERAAEAAEAEADGGDPDAPTAVAPMKVPFRRTK